MSQPFMISTFVVAKALSISAAAVYQLARDDKLPFPAYRFGRIIKFKRVEVEQFIGEPLDEIIEAVAAEKAESK